MNNWQPAPLPLPITSIPCPSTAAVTFAHLSPCLSAEADTGLALPAGPSELCRGGLAASNEIPLVRSETSTTSPAFSNTSAKWRTGRG